MAHPVAIVTGGSSGIGLALSKYLLERDWNVVVADMNPPPTDSSEASRIKFIKTDVSDWDSQAAMFAEAYAWRGRLDFCALNAGIDDRDDIFFTLSQDPAKPPVKPSMKTFDVNLFGPYYGVKLGSHYMTLDSTTAGKTKIGGKFVVTASSAGIFPIVGAPQYGATKHGVVGLVRSMGGLPDGAKAHNITINAVCPAVVDTKIMSRQIYDGVTPANITPMSTIMRCFEELALLSHSGEADWVDKGPTGQTLEGNMDKLIWHSFPDVSDRDPKVLALIGGTLTAGLRQRNIDFARANAEEHHASISRT